MFVNEGAIEWVQSEVYQLEEEAKAIETVLERDGNSAEERSSYAFTAGGLNRCSVIQATPLVRAQAARSSQSIQ